VNPELFRNRDKPKAAQLYHWCNEIVLCITCFRSKIK